MNGLNTPVYMHDSFGNLVDLLYALRVFGVRYHKISHQLNMVRSGTSFTPPGHWIPLPVADLSMNFIEIIPLSEVKSGDTKIF